MGRYFDKKDEICDKNRKKFQLFWLNLLHYFLLCFIIKTPKWWKMVCDGGQVIDKHLPVREMVSFILHKSAARYIKYPISEKGEAQ